MVFHHQCVSRAGTRTAPICRTRDDIGARKRPIESSAGLYKREVCVLNPMLCTALTGNVCQRARTRVPGFILYFLAEEVALTCFMSGVERAS